jgi:hypothetical protein
MSFTAKITADITKFEQNIDKAIDSTNRLEKTVLQKLTNMGDSFVNVGKKASVLSAALVAAGSKAFMMAADFEDAIGATGQIFGENADIVKGWADTLGTEYGIAKKEALEYSNLMGSMLINIGKLTEEQAARQSAKLIELAGDLTAMYGGRTQDAIRALTGALKGNNTMLDNYGMAVNDALIKTKAFEMGLSDGTGELSLQAKQAATLALIYEQTTAAQGQAAREADGASGAMRALTTEVKNLSTELGQVLIPVITPVVAGIRDMVAGLRTLSPEMQTLVVTTGAITAAAGPLLIVIGKILTYLPKIKVAIAALNGPIVAIGAAMVVAVANFGKNIEALKTDWDYLLNHLRTTSAAIGDVLSGNLSGWWSKVRTTWGKNIDYLRDKWEQFIAYFTGKKGLNQSQAELEAALAANEMTGSAGAMQEVATSAAIAASSVDNLATSFKELGEAQDAATAKIVPDDVTGASVLAPVIEPTIDAQGLKEKLRDATYGALADLGEGIKVLTIDLSSMLGNALTDVFGSVADAMMNGDNMMAALGTSLLGTLGGIMVQLGQMVIATGSAIEAVKAALSRLGGIGAIAAGAALIAIGSAFASGARKLSQSMGSVGGYSSAPSMVNTSPSYGPSEYRGPYRDDFKVEFKIGSNELVGVLDTAEQRRNRL